MNQLDIKKKLRQHGCKVWQLFNILGISRNQYYELSHQMFKGHEATVKKGIHEVIQKAGVTNAD